MAIEQTTDPEQQGETRMANTALNIADDAIANEIRIVQSVQVQSNMPIIIGGSMLMIAIAIAIDWRASVDSYAIYFLFAVLVMFTPMLLSYLRLRNRPRPNKVSKRRIRLLEIYSFLLGLVWSVAVLLFMSEMEPITGVVWLWTGYVMCYAGPFLISSLPRAAVAYSCPVSLANFFAAYVNDILPTELLVFLCVTGISALAWIIRQSWKQSRQMVIVSLENVQSEAERNQMLETVSTQLGKYMSSQLYESIFRGEQKVEIASKRKKLTVFFSDIASFTEITDQLESEELTALLNRYLTEMSQIALEHGATIDKFIGDAIVVYFGDPDTLGVKEDADQCVHMAVAMQERVRELSTEWIDMGLERTFELRIGINTGYCTVGNFGSDDRMDYTIIGSEVNLAARLEAAADVGGILLANETYSLVKDWVDVDEGAPITVKGFPRPVKTFRVKGTKDNIQSNENVFHRELDGLKLTLNHNTLVGSKKHEAVKMLKDTLEQLENSDDSQ